MIDTDVIDTLAGIEPGSALDALRNRRPARRLLREPPEPSWLPPLWRRVAPERGPEDPRAR